MLGATRSCDGDLRTGVIFPEYQGVALIKAQKQALAPIRVDLKVDPNDMAAGELL
jgi:hypothetical protein